jgi:hypothetical protein
VAGVLGATQEDPNVGMASPQIRDVRKTRRVDLSRELTKTFETLQLERQLEAVTRQGKDLLPWVFCDDQGHQWHHNYVRVKFFKLLIFATHSRPCCSSREKVPSM